MNDMTTHLSEAAKELLIEAAQDTGGTILRFTSIGGAVSLRTNGRMFGDGTPTDQARWKDGLTQLCSFGLIEPVGDKGQVFCITPEGYEVADILRSQGQQSRMS